MANGVLPETRDGKDEVLAMAVPGHKGTGFQSLKSATFIHLRS